MARKNYKWNISLKEGQNITLSIIKGILTEKKNETMEINELLLLIANRSKHLVITNNQKKKSLVNFINTNYGSLIRFADEFTCLAVFDDSKGKRIKFLDESFPLLNEWIYVE